MEGIEECFAERTLFWKKKKTALVKYYSWLILIQSLEANNSLQNPTILCNFIFFYLEAFFIKKKRFVLEKNHKFRAIERHE